MHFEILVEDASGELLLQELLPKILGKSGDRHTWRTHSYKGIGRLPKNLRGTTDPAKRILLDRLPRILAGYGTSFRNTNSAVVVITDLDSRNCVVFKQELLGTLRQCQPKPRVLFRIAIEEGEAWLLGDRAAVLKAFPRAKPNVLDTYVQDSICGTWEKLADAVLPDGAAGLTREGWPRIGQEKCKWAVQIGRHINVDANASQSFRVFRRGLLSLCED